jgi:hypothetical protein
MHVVLISYVAIPKIKTESTNYEGLSHSVTIMKGKEHCLCFVGGNTVGYKNLNKPLITQVKTHEWLLAALLSRMSGAAVGCCPSIHFNLRAARDKPLAEKAQLLR